MSAAEGDGPMNRDEPMANNPLDLDIARHIALAPGGYGRAQVALAADRVVTEVDRLRAELAETRDRRAYLQGQLDIIYDAEYSRNDALRRENARLRDAGNALAAGVDEHLMGAGEWGPLVEERRAWRSAAGTPTPNAGEQT